MQLTLSDIKKRFEHKSYSERMDFLNEYNFKDSYREYYWEVVSKNLITVKDPHYLSELIDFCGRMNFEDDEIYSAILRLINSGEFIVQLSVFDYLKRVKKFYNDEQSEGKVLMFLKNYLLKFKEREKFIPFMSYQVLTELKVYQKDLLKAKEYFLEYLHLLKESDNSAMIWRAYNDALSEPNLYPFRELIIETAFRLNEKLGFNHIMRKQ